MSNLITEEVRAETMAKLTTEQEKLATELALLECLEGHRISQQDNLGYYRTRVHCSCAAEWWTGDHTGDPDWWSMWNIHRAEVIAAFMKDRATSVEGQTK